MNIAPHTVDVDVPGGKLRVAVWEPVDASAATPTILAVHGVTSSHLAWQWVAAVLPDVRIIAPDLRGRGASRDVLGPAGMAAHAADLDAVLAEFDAERVLALGHSMGAFVVLTLAHRHPHRVSSLVLVDGGLPLDVPAGMEPDAVVSSLLGPTAKRLSMRFPDTEAYLDFWKAHPAFVGAWSAQLDRYFAYDLVDAGDARVPATSYDTTREDTIDVNTGSAAPEALTALAHPTRLITVPRGLQNERPGLYAPNRLAHVLERNPGVDHVRLPDLNHYTVVMSAAGAEKIAPLITGMLAPTTEMNRG